MKNLDDIINPTFIWINNEKKVAIATVISTWGSSPRQIGGQMSVNEDGEFIGSVSGGCVETSVIHEALACIKDGKHRIKDYGITNDLAWEVGLACGGSLKVLIQPLDFNDKIINTVKRKIDKRERVCITSNCKTGSRKVISDINQELPKNSYFDKYNQIFYHIIEPRMRLFIIGGVHLAQALSSLANVCEYEIIIIDPRNYFANSERFPNNRIINEWPDIAFKDLTLGKNDSIVALTHDPKIDDQAIKLALNSNIGYIGALGSKKTHDKRVQRLKKEGFNDLKISKIHAPIGIDINSKTPPEIAVSIIAELIKVKHSKLKLEQNV